MKNELIKVTYEEEKALVGARELHEFLEVKQDFTDWIKKQLENVEAVLNEDYTEIWYKSDDPFKKVVEFNGNVNSMTRNGNEKDYVITLDIAKEINMIAGIAPRCNSETKKKSKEARKYFIECEKKLKEVINKPILPQDYLSALKALVASEEEKALMKPKVEYYESTLRPDTYVKLLTSSEVAKDLGISAQKLHTRLNELGVIYKQNKTWMLYSKYQDRVPEYCDYTINEHSQTLKWTEKGREWIIGLLKENN